jgi:hypothetical protein
MWWYVRLTNVMNSATARFDAVIERQLMWVKINTENTGSACVAIFIVMLIMHFKGFLSLLCIIINFTILAGIGVVAAGSYGYLRYLQAIRGESDVCLELITEAEAAELKTGEDHGICATRIERDPHKVRDYYVPDVLGKLVSSPLLFSVEYSTKPRNDPNLITLDVFWRTKNYIPRNDCLVV